MKLSAVVLACANRIARPARAALPAGAPAPDFSADAALGGTTLRFSLAQALKQGPVVLYFYPKAYTRGCTVEAHAFAEAAPAFEELRAQLIGMSNDDIATLQRFSAEACRSRFPLAADPDGRIMQRYHAGLWFKPDMAARLSYVISPAGKVLYSYSSLDPAHHVENTLEAVRQWRRDNPG